MRNKKFLTLFVACLTIAALAVTSLTIFGLDINKNDIIDKVENKVDREFVEKFVDLFNKTAKELDVSASATYVDGELTLVASTTGVDELIDIVSLAKFKDIVTAAVPSLKLTEEFTLDGKVVFDGSVQYAGIKNFVLNNYMTFSDFANLKSQTLGKFEAGVTVDGKEFNLPVTLKIDIADSKFAAMQKASATLAKYIEVKYEDSTVKVFVDATDLYDYALASDCLSKYTTKQLRDTMNGTTVYDVLAKAEAVVLPAKFERFQNEYDLVIGLCNKVITKVESTKYAPVLNSMLGLLDMDNDGVYEYGDTVTVKGVSFSYNLAIAVHDQYTATFVAEDGTVVYETTILEGEVPEFKGKVPYKAADVEYTYIFAGWSDGTNVYFDEFPALLADTTYVATYDKESNACKHTDKEEIPETPANCCYPGTTAGWICLNPECAAIFGCDVIPATGDHITEVVGAYPAECGKPGFTGKTYCKVSGILLDEGTEIPALDHEWGDWFVVTPADIGVPGLEKRVCGLCGAEETRDIDALPVPTPTPTPTPDTPVVTPDTPVVTPDTPVVTPDTPVVTPDTPVVTPDTPDVTPDVTPEETTPVVPDETETPEPPKTGDSTVVFFAIGSVVVLAVAFAIIVLKKKTMVL